MQTLRLFHDVARLHSFSEAAALHGVTQSAASQRISALEKRLGLTLLDRSVRPLGLTEAGRIYLQGAQELLERYDRLEQRVARLAVQPSGVIRVSAIYSAGIDLLNTVREKFEEVHTQVEVQIRYDQPQRVYEAVRDDACELGIVSYPRHWRGMGIVPLRDEVMAVVCRPGHPLARRERVRPDDLIGLSMAGFDLALPAGRWIREYLREAEVLSDIQITSVFDNIDTIKGAIAVTDEFSILPKRTVARESRAGGLVIVELEPRLVRPIGVIYRPRRAGRRAAEQAPEFSPAVQAFVDFLLDHAGPSVDLVEEAMRGEVLETDWKLVGAE